VSSRKEGSKAELRRRRLGLIFLAIVVLFAVIPILIRVPFVTHILVLAFIYAIAAASWDLLSGYTGQLSFAHGAFLATGAYFCAIVTENLGWPPWVSILGAGVFMMVVGAGVGAPALRLHGHYLAITTLSINEIIRLVSMNWVSFTGGPYGFVVARRDFPGSPFPSFPQDPTLSKTYFYYLALGCLVVCGLTMYFLCERSRVGKAFKSIREDEDLAESLGINVTFYKVLAFSLSCFFVGIAGGLYATYIKLVDPSIALATNSGLIVGMVLLGGRGTIWGAAIGGISLYVAYQLLRFVGVVYNLIAVGAVIVVFIILFPAGIWGIVETALIKAEGGVLYKRRSE